MLYEVITNKKVNQLAKKLKTMGIKPDSVVAIMIVITSYSIHYTKLYETPLFDIVFDSQNINITGNQNTNIGGVSGENTP